MSWTIGYLLNIACAVFFIWRASESNDRGAMFLLFAAAFMIIHAHGSRITDPRSDQGQERQLAAKEPPHV